jgi:hypothetical protein
MFRKECSLQFNDRADWTNLLDCSWHSNCFLNTSWRTSTLDKGKIRNDRQNRELLRRERMNQSIHHGTVRWKLLFKGIRYAHIFGATEKQDHHIERDNKNEFSI